MQYVAFHKDNESLGAAIKATIVAMSQEMDIQPFLEQHHLENLEEDKWYPQQSELDLMKDMSQRGYFNLVSIGMKIPDIAVFPPEIKTVEEALNLLEMAYQINHRGPDLGNYDFKLVGEGKGVMTCHNPYPSDLDYGIIYRLTQKFRPSTQSKIAVRRDDSIQNRTTGGDTCVYYIEW